jgi:hypothetical protein
MAYLYHMRTILVALICLLFGSVAYAQKDSLQLDENNRYVYYHVVDKPGLTADTLYNRLKLYVRSPSFKSADVKLTPSQITVTGNFLVYNGSSVMRKESGAVTFELFIETRDQKYRYKVYNFIFTPYIRDRFNNMVPAAGGGLPIEKLQAKYTKKDVINIMAQVGSFSTTTGQKLQLYAEKVPSSPQNTPVKQVDTKKW